MARRNLQGAPGVLPMSLSNAFGLFAPTGARIRLARLDGDHWRASFTDTSGAERVSFFSAPDRDAAKAQIPEGRFFR